MRITITGAGGQLGRALERALAPTHACRALPRRELDIADLDAVRACLETEPPDLLLNCAAATDVDGCERDPERAYRVNAWGAAVLASLCARLAIRLIQFSTDFVFDGEKGTPYLEYDPPRPVNVYGASKLAGERAVLESGADALVLRTQWLYGGGTGDFPLAILRAAARGAPLRVVDDQFGAPTYAADLAEQVARLLELPLRGVIHLNNAGECSRWEWARETLRLAGRADAAVERIPSEAWPAPARRPPRSTLRRFALEQLGAPPPRDWRAALADYVEALRAAGQLPGADAPRAAVDSGAERPVE